MPPSFFTPLKGRGKHFTYHITELLSLSFLSVLARPLLIFSCPAEREPERTTMHTNLQARWISRQRLHQLQKVGLPREALHLNHLSGIVAVEPIGSDLGDGAILEPHEADYELQPAWILDSKARLRQARRLLGLEAEQMAFAVAYPVH